MAIHSPSSNFRRNGTVTRRCAASDAASMRSSTPSSEARSRFSRANSQSSTASSSSMPRASGALAQQLAALRLRRAASGRSACTRTIAKRDRAARARSAPAARCAANSKRRAFGAAAVVEIEQRVLGGRVAGDRVDIVDREQVAAAERADRGRRVRAQRRQRQILRAAPGRVRRGAGRDQQMRAAAAERAGEDKAQSAPVSAAARRSRSTRDAIVAGARTLESLMRRPAQRQRQLLRS